MAIVKRNYVGDSGVKYNTGTSLINNGLVTPNATAQGAPGSRGTSTGTVLPVGKGGSLTGWIASQGGLPTQQSKTTTGGSTKSSGSSSSGSNTANAYNALLAAYKQNDYSNYLNEMRAAAQNAYDRGMSALNNAYDAQLNSLNSNLSETKNQLLNQYNRSKQNITDDAASSLRQAYINKMMSQKNLGQQLSAMGLTGGATESSLNNLLNSYGNARNQINTTQNRNLSNLEGNYNDNLSTAMQAYNSAVASANLQKAQQQMSLENALANNQISALGDYQTLMQRENQNYLDLLKTAIANGASFSYDPTSANNAFNAVNVQQAATPNTVNTLTALQELMGAENTPGVTMPGITVANTGATSNPYAYILNQLLGQRGAY